VTIEHPHAADRSLATVVDDFLTDLSQSNRSIHTRTTELVNDGISLATIRKRLGHQNLQTTLRYAEQADATADAEVRAWRRRRMKQART
jgi:hypothetical protein